MTARTRYGGITIRWPDGMIDGNTTFDPADFRSVVPRFTEKNQARARAELRQEPGLPPSRFCGSNPVHTGSRRCTRSGWNNPSFEVGVRHRIGLVNFCADFSPNLAATIVGIASGVPAALAIERVLDRGRERKAAEGKRDRLKALVAVLAQASMRTCLWLQRQNRTLRQERLWWPLI
jgi:hypothetical protein